MTEAPGTDPDLRYDLWIDEPLRGIVRRALGRVAEDGLPGRHHFFITFRTTAEGVVMPAAQRAQFPDEMTIVLQHRFWNLTVAEDAFEVVLSFGGRQAPMRIPFAAITGFADPSVNFALQFKPAGETGMRAPAAGQPPPGDAPGEASPAAAETAVAPGGPAASEKIVALDSFRKKS